VLCCDVASECMECVSQQGDSCRLHHTQPLADAGVNGPDVAISFQASLIHRLGASSRCLHQHHTLGVASRQIHGARVRLTKEPLGVIHTCAGTLWVPARVPAPGHLSAPFMESIWHQEAMVQLPYYLCITPTTRMHSRYCIVLPIFMTPRGSKRWSRVPSVVPESQPCSMTLLTGNQPPTRPSHKTSPWHAPRAIHWEHEST
jgi:hypothetical protein